MAIDELKSYQRCPRCTGLGKYTEGTTSGSVVTDPCNICGGSGYVPVGRVDGAEHFDKILKRLKKIMDKLEVTE